MVTVVNSVGSRFLVFSKVSDTSAMPDAARVRDNVKAGGQTVTAPDAAQEAQWRDKLDPVDAGYINNVPNGAAILSSYRQLLAAAKAK